MLTFVLTASNNDPTFSNSNNVKTGIVSASGAQVQTFSITADPNTNLFGVATVQYYFVATQSSTVITVGSTTPYYYGPIIDNVKLSPVVSVQLSIILICTITNANFTISILMPLLTHGCQLPQHFQHPMEIL